MKSIILLSIICLFINIAFGQQYRPVVLMHGVNSDASSMDEVVTWIQNALPGIYVVNMEIGDGKWDSIFKTMDEQVEIYSQNVLADPKLANGFNAIGFSQGTLVTRGYIEKFNNPPVHNFISWAGPQNGQFGTPYLNIKWIDELLDTTPYSEFVQKTFGVGGYWKSPYAMEQYLDDSAYLADLNNERTVKNQTYYNNINSLNAMVLSYSLNDEVIVPKESGIFGFYADDTQKTIVPLQQSQQYIEDWIGLRSLDQSGRLHFYNTTCKHGEHPTSVCYQYFESFTLPFLQN
ncbi:palmitoyl-protein thioesterase 3 [Tieghemostelium lacteum]|uniref:Palmitoyl-protein thioesterase 3 n=1 Tax=Tieghemostelium lacteum TaxID=361077 RepID=A0A151ZH02_TIELA|nr:palmitoyl-protein thioesterase 3 [Tieghemostelium lacteum]|eukprot:KYQ93246.1 palmitoyl-protein thioesterase 3 [Tieghemostelium lacteum]